MKDQTGLLAGLGFAFEPVALARPPQAQRAPLGRGRRAAAPPPPAAAPAAKAVDFNLRERGPGPAYGSPPPAAEQSQPQQPQSDAGSRPGSAAHSAAGLAALKLASLRRRAVQATAPVAPEPALPAHAAAGADAAHTQQQQQQPEVEGALLRGMEAALVGCAAGVLEQAPAQLLPAQHVLLGLPALAPGPPEPQLQAAADGTPGAALPEGLIGAYRPADGGGAGAPAESGAPASCSQAGGGVGAAPAEAHPVAACPQTLEEALRCLGLLAPHPAAEEPGSQAPAPASSEAAAGQPQWVRLRAVWLVVAAKQRAAAAAEVLPLLQRLRQVRMHLEFHQVRGSRPGVNCYA